MGHAVAEALAALEEALDSQPDALLYSLTDDDLIAVLPRLERVLARVDGQLRLPLIAEVDGRDLARRHGATNTAAWLWQFLPYHKGQASKLVKLARSICDGPLAATGKALAAGDCSTEHAAVIDQSMKKLPADLDTLERARAEQTLLGLAPSLDLELFGKAGDHVHETIDPDGHAAREKKRLRRQEQRAKKARWASEYGTGIPGVIELRWRADEETLAKLHAMVDPLTRPRKEADGSPDSRPYQRRLGDGLAELVDTWSGTVLPDNPERKHPVMVIRVDFDHASERLGAGTLDTGEQLSPELVAKLSCEADLVAVWMTYGLIPVAVATPHRFFDPQQRAALIARDGGCAFPACDRPAKRCHAHHITPFRISHRTAVQDGVLLCGRHHDLIHHGDWTIHIAGDGLPEFVPPPWVDPQQKPLRHHRHQRRHQKHLG